MNTKYFEISFVFFKLGCIAFGGPAAHIAMMEQEIVERRKWMTQQEFLDLLGVTHLLPGPNSTEMAIHCGYQRGGWLGLFLAGISFLFPATILTILCAMAYVEFGKLSVMDSAMMGIRAAVIAIIIKAVWKLGQKALKTNELAILTTIILIAVSLGLNEMLAILGGGILGALCLGDYHSWRKKSCGLIIVMILFSGSMAYATNATVASVALPQLFESFLKIGSILFGSGYVLIAYLEAEFIQGLGWLTTNQVLDAVAIGQLTPGPVLSTATFVGYVLAGVPGALLATLGIFLPAFLIVGLTSPWIPRIRKSKFLSLLLDCVNAAVIAVMIKVTLQLGIPQLFSVKSAVILLVATGLVFGLKKISPMIVIAVGLLLSFLM